MTVPDAPLRDVETVADVEAVVTAFYGTIAADPVLGPFFAHLDMTEHVERLARFWSSVVFSTATYKGQPLEKHVGLGLAPAHFVAWLLRFERVVGERFAGENADRMRQRARQIAAVFQIRLGLDPATPLA